MDNTVIDKSLKIWELDGSHGPIATSVDTGTPNFPDPFRKAIQQFAGTVLEIENDWLITEKIDTETGETYTAQYFWDERAGEWKESRLEY